MTPAEGRELVAAWQRSGLGPAEFCRSEGVTVNRLSYWRRKAPAIGFVETVIEEESPQHEPGQPAGEIEVVVGDTFVRFPDRPGMAEEILVALARVSS